MVREEGTSATYPVTHVICTVASAIGGLLAIAFCVFLTASCGGSGGISPELAIEPVAAQPAGVDASGFAGIPGPQGIKESSFYQEDMERLGWQFSDAFDAPRNNVSVDGAFARFDGEWLDIMRDLEGLAFCMYDFEMTDYDGANEFNFDWMQSSEEGEAYVGFSDWENNTFEWRLIPADGKVNIDLSKYIQEGTGRMFVMVMVLGQNPWVLGGVTVGEPTGGMCAVSGYICEPDGSPLRNTRVHLTGDRDRWATTDYAGRYEYTYLPNGNYNVEPQPRQHNCAPSSRPVVVDDAPVLVDTFTATPANQQCILGRITSKQGGVPMAGVAVKLHDAGTGQYIRQVKTGLEGNFSLDVVPGSYTVEASAAGWSFAPLQYQVEVTVADVPGRDFSGRAALCLPVDGYVRNGQGEGEPGVEIFLEGGRVYNTFTDNQGYWKVDNALSGTYNLSAYKKNKTCAPDKQRLVVADQPVRAADIICADIGRARVYGYCTKADGVTPEPGVSIDITCRNYYRTTSDENGYWEVPDMEEGACIIEPWKEDYIVTPEQRYMTVSGTTRIGNFKCVPRGTGTMSGRVLCPVRAGDGLEGVAVNIDCDLWGFHVDTDADGNWERLDVPDGSYTVRPFKNGYDFEPAQRQVVVNGGQAEVPAFTATEELTGGAEGWVFAADGMTPLEGVRVLFDGPEIRSVTTGADGYWRINELEQGEYTVTPSKDGHYFTPESREEAIEGNIVTLDDFLGTALATWKLQGYVLEDDGVTPLSGIDLEVQGDTTYLVTSDAVGHWSAMVLEGTYLVEATTIGYSYAPASQPLVVDRDMTAADILATQLVRHTISGTVYQPDGVTPMAGVMVGAGGNYWSDTQTDDQGNWSLELYEGVYTVYADSFGYYFTPWQQVVFNYADKVLDDFVAHEYE